MASDLVKLGEVAGWWKTLRPLTHSSDLTREGLAVDATHTSERWVPIIGYEGRYEVSNRGDIRSCDRIVLRSDGKQQSVRGRVLSKRICHSGHLTVSLWRDNQGETRYVHRLVAETFIGDPPPGAEVCHANGDPADNRVENLRWDSRSANVIDEVEARRHWQSAKTHCKRGHEYTPENTKVGRTRGRGTRRVCRICNAEWQRAYHAKRKSR